jgi:hypothetical protein
MHVDLRFKSYLSVEPVLLLDKVSMTQTLRKTMKTVAIDRFGGVETLETQELPIPAAGADEVLVHVEAAGVGVWDPR